MVRENKECFYIKSHGPNKSALVKGFKWLGKLCSNSSLCKALLAVPTKDDILSDIVSEVIGKKVAKSLSKENKVRFKLGGKTLEISLLTEKQNTYKWQAQIILAIYPNKKLLDKIDGLYKVTHVLVIPRQMKEVEPWINMWSACDLDNPSYSTKRDILSNKVVEEALKTLTNSVDLSAEIPSPGDRKRTIDLFMKLKEAGEIFNPEEIRDWLIVEGNCNPKGANDVKDIAEKVLKGHRLRRTGKYWKDDIVENWRKRCGKT